MVLLLEVLLWQFLSVYCWEESQEATVIKVFLIVLGKKKMLLIQLRDT